MLILTRKVNDAIVIAGNIEIHISRIDGDTVKLGISAPRHIPIVRKEVLADIAANNQGAAVATAGSSLRLPGFSSVQLSPKPSSP